MDQIKKTRAAVCHSRVLLLAGLCLLLFFSGPAEAVAAADGSYIYDPAAGAVKKGNVINSWEEFEASQLPLIAALPEKDIFLYAVKPRGVILYVKDTGHYYDWYYLTPRFVLPSLYTGDYDSDGEEEVAVVTYTGSGTGVSVEELHMIEAGKEEILSRDPDSKDYFVPNPEYFRDHFYIPDTYIAQLEKVIGLKAYDKGNEKMLDVSMADRKYPLSLKAFQEWDKDFTVNERPCLGNIVRFSCDGNIINAEFALGVTLDTAASPIIIGDIKAQVVYEEDGFVLKNLNFVPEEEYIAESTPAGTAVDK